MGWIIEKYFQYICGKFVKNDCKNNTNDYLFEYLFEFDVISFTRKILKFLTFLFVNKKLYWPKKMLKKFWKYHTIVGLFLSKIKIM